MSNLATTTRTQPTHENHRAIANTLSCNSLTFSKIWGGVLAKTLQPNRKLFKRHTTEPTAHPS